MRKHLLFLTLSIFLSACGNVNTIRVSKDEFRQEERIVLEQSYYAREYDVGLQNPLIKLKANRTNKQGGYGPPELILTFDAEIGYVPDNQVFVKANERVHRLDVQQVNVFDKYDKTTKSSTTTKTNTTTKSEPDVTEKEEKKKTTTETETEVLVENNEHEYNYSIFNLKAILDAETIADILITEDMTIRFYINNEPISMKVSREKIRKWKAFLSIYR